MSCLATAGAAGGCGLVGGDAPGDPALATTEQGLSTAGAVLTQHVDPARTGLNPAETQLSWASVPSNFGKLFTVPVDGRLFAQPLYAPAVATSAGARDLVILATEANTVYAADAHTGAVVWQRNLGTPIPSLDAYPSQCVNIPGTIGITGTPVIDPATGTIYVVSATKVAGVYHQNLHALDVASGAPRAGSPREIAAQVPGDGPAAVGGLIAFDPLRANQRAGLLLQGGKVYVAWASHCDDAIDFVKTPQQPEIFFGWMMSFDAATLARTAVFNTAPHADPSNPEIPYGGSIWHGAGGLASDGTRIYANTGAALFDPASGDWGDSTLAFTPSLTLADSFTPADQAQLDAEDLDLSAGGVVVVPTGVPQHPDLLITSGKEGTIYVLDRDHLGGAQLGSDTVCPANQAAQGCVVGRAFDAIGIQGDVGAFFGLPAYFNGRVYFAGNGDRMKMFSVGGSSALSGVLGQTATIFRYPGSTPSVSANGTSDGIVWALERTQPEPFTFPDPTHLHAYRADTLAELYNSKTTSEDPDGAGQFMTPTIAGGQVMIGTSTSLAVYGTVLRPSPASQSVVQGNATTFTIATPVMTPSPSIALAVTGLPAGAAAVFSPATITGGASSTLSITTAGATAPGTYPLTITGTSGALTRTTSVALVVVHRDLPPTAAFTVTCIGRRCSFDASTSSDPEGPLANYGWTFGDGSPMITGTQFVTTSHLFPFAGSFNVTLGVMDSAGQINVTTRAIAVIDALPTAAFTASCSIWQCTFNAAASSDVEGPIAAYAWSFGDGSAAAAGVNPGHAYTANGTYSVTLTVTDSAGQTAQVTHAAQAIDQPPHPVFSTVCGALTCAVDSEGSSDDVFIANYRWDWGDGTSTSGGSSASATSHTYAAFGSVTITLTETDSIGQTAAVSHTVTLVPGPTAAFTFTCTGLTCQFDASSSTSAAGGLSYHWDWDDETTSDPSTPRTSHSFDLPGTYHVHLMVTDANSQSAGVTQAVAVNGAISVGGGGIDPPPPPPPQRSVQRAP